MIDLEVVVGRKQMVEEAVSLCSMDQLHDSNC